MRLLEIRNCLTEFVSFSHLHICKPLRVQKNYLFGTLSQSNSCLVGVNLIWQCFREVSEICPKEENKCPKTNRPNSFGSNISYLLIQQNKAE